MKNITFGSSVKSYLDSAQLAVSDLGPKSKALYASISDPKEVKAVVEALFEQAVKKSISLNTPISFAKAAADFAEYFSQIENLTGLLRQTLSFIDQPRQLLKLASDVKKLASAFLGTNDSLRNDSAKLSKLIFSIGYQACKSLTFLRATGLFLPSLALATPIGFLGAACGILSVLAPMAINAHQAYYATETSPDQASMPQMAIQMFMDGKMTDILGSSQLASLAEFVGGNTLKGVVLLTAAASSMLSARKDLNGSVEKQTLSQTIPACVNSGLAVCGHLTGARVEVLSSGLDLIPAGYNLYAEGYLPTSVTTYLSSLKSTN